MAAERIPPATESISLPKPSIAPAFFAFGLALAVAGIYLVFMGPSWAYVAAGLIIAVASFAGMVKLSIRSYYRLPRRQDLSTAPLPADTIAPPRRRRDQPSD